MDRGRGLHGWVLFLDVVWRDWNIWSGIDAWWWNLAQWVYKWNYKYSVEVELGRCVWCSWKNYISLYSNRSFDLEMAKCLRVNPKAGGIMLRVGFELLTICVSIWVRDTQNYNGNARLMSRWHFYLRLKSVMHLVFLVGL